jgi:hypothetical protein
LGSVDRRIKGHGPVASTPALARAERVLVNAPVAKTLPGAKGQCCRADVCCAWPGRRLRRAPMLTPHDLADRAERRPGR